MIFRTWKRFSIRLSSFCYSRDDCLLWHLFYCEVLQFCSNFQDRTRKYEQHERCCCWRRISSIVNFQAFSLKAFKRSARSQVFGSIKVSKVKPLLFTYSKRYRLKSFSFLCIKICCQIEPRASVKNENLEIFHLLCYLTRFESKERTVIFWRMRISKSSKLYGKKLDPVKNKKFPESFLKK